MVFFFDSVYVDFIRFCIRACRCQVHPAHKCRKKLGRRVAHFHLTLVRTFHPPTKTPLGQTARYDSRLIKFRGKTPRNSFSL